MNISQKYFYMFLYGFSSFSILMVCLFIYNFLVLFPFCYVVGMQGRDPSLLSLLVVKLPVFSTVVIPFFIAKHGFSIGGKREVSNIPIKTFHVFLLILISVISIFFISYFFPFIMINPFNNFCN